jgi:hypothetical protein
MKAGIAPGTGKLTGRFCVRAPAKAGSNRVRFMGCFKSKEAAEKRLSEAKK